MNRSTVSALALVATSLTCSAYAQEAAAPVPTNPEAVGAKPAARPVAAPGVSAKPRPAAAKPASPKPVAAKPVVAKPKAVAPVAPPEAEEPVPEAEPASPESDALLPDGRKEPTPAPAAPERPLSLRKSPDQPLAMSSAPPSDGLWFKLGLCCLIVGGAVWLLRKRGLLAPPAKAQAMTILGRTSIGVRSELLLVEVEGQKLVLGVTPSTVSRLAVLPIDGDAPSTVARDLDPAEAVDQEPGFDEALDQARAKLEEFAARVKKTTGPSLERRTRPPETRRPSTAPRAPQPSSAPRAPLTNDDEARAEARREALRTRAREARGERESHAVRESRSDRASRNERESRVERELRELRELRASRPEVPSRAELGEQAQSLMKLRQSRSQG